jgi:hypothetical protein
VPILGMTYLGPLGAFVRLRMTGFQYGESGGFKTSLAALGQAHYGDYDLNTLPLNFEGTPVGAEIVLFSMKDALIVTDVFLKNGTPGEVKKRLAILNRIIRTVGNQAGGARGTKYLTLRSEMPPRGLPLVTAETRIIGQSTNARVLFDYVRKGDISFDKIVAAGSESKRRLYAVAMGAYVQWIARNWGALEQNVPRRLEELTEEFLRFGTHSRQPGNAALVMLGIETALAFMLEVGAIDPLTAPKICDKARSALIDITIE